jgi:hypothetical protein
MRTGLAVIISYVDAWSRDIRFGRVVYYDPRGTCRRFGTRRESRHLVPNALTVSRGS